MLTQSDRAGHYFLWLFILVEMIRDDPFTLKKKQINGIGRVGKFEVH